MHLKAACRFGLSLSLSMVDFDYHKEELEVKLRQVRTKAARLSGLRLLVFFVMGAFLILAMAESVIWLIPGFLSGWGFVYLIQAFNSAKDQESIYLALAKMDIQKKARQDRKLNDLDSGLEFADKGHPFSGDLDLFGAHSLFQLLNHTTSTGGKHKLAAAMSSDFSADLAKSRAEAVSELMEKGQFLGAMESVGMAFWNQRSIANQWKSWLTETDKITGFHRILAFLGPFGGLTLVILVSQGLLPTVVLGVWMLVGILFLGQVFKPLKRAAEAVPPALMLKSSLIRAHLIENQTFTSKLLQRDQAQLFSEGISASTRLRELDRLGLWAQNRINLLYLPLNLLFWTDFFLFVRLANWKKSVGSSLQHLHEILEDWEVWVSLGSFEVEVGYSGLAEWAEENVLVAEEAIHPLIQTEKAVGNSVSLGTKQGIVLLTGANMSGKTTFMRTLGINAVLVHLGLRPFAKRFAFGPVQLYTSMRNSDNLGESVSSFYAELNRIRTLIHRLESGEGIFFLLDEILKGTNTQDRISGSEALIHQILHTNGFGIISTHDIELSGLEKSVSKVSNYSFHSEIQDQTIQFDYKLKAGPCPSFNAHKLMELMGIRFEKN